MGINNILQDYYSSDTTECHRAQLIHFKREVRCIEVLNILFLWATLIFFFLFIVFKFTFNIVFNCEETAAAASYA